MPRIATIDDLRRYLDHVGDEERVDPQNLIDALDSAESWVEMYTGRQFSPEPAFVAGVDSAAAVEKTFAVRSSGWIRIPDLRTVESIDAGGSDLEEWIDYELDYSSVEPHITIKLLHASPLSNPFAVSNVVHLTIVGRWGWAVPPPHVKDAVLALAARQYRRRDAMFADVVDRGTIAFEYRSGVPNFITAFLDPLKVPRVAVV